MQYSEVNKALDLISATMMTISNHTNSICKEDVVNALDEALGKTPQRRNITRLR